MRKKKFHVTGTGKILEAPMMLTNIASEES